MLDVNSRIYEVTFAKSHARFELVDGRLVAVPLDWFPALQAGSIAERQAYAIEDDGAVAVWAGLGERVSVAGIMTMRAPPE